MKSLKISRKRQEKISEFRQTVMNPFIAAGYGIVDDIIEPRFSRIELIRSLEMNIRKREDRPSKKHGNPSVGAGENNEC